jgi:molecular chaperone DnaJ
MNKDLYKILEVEKTATQKEIKDSYRVLSKRYHPDLNPDNPESEEKFKEVSDAYSVLSNEEKRKNYDTYGSVNPPQMDDINMRDIYESFFRNNGGGRRPGGDIRINLELTLNEIYSGVNKKMKYKRHVDCVSCSGEGGETAVCQTCNGQGMVTQVLRTPMGMIHNTISCPTCNGLGKKIINNCETCSGHGISLKEEIIDIEIPRGVMNNEMIRFNSKGNFVKSGSYGDLYVNILERPHETFKRSGMDLYQRINFTYKELVMGTDYEINTLEGKIKIKVKPSTKIGALMRIPGKGLFRSGNVGDIIIEVWLIIPDNLDESELDKIKLLN